ncbi:MAG: 4-hydroxy-tetrahydrodipicolinate reductase, partial [Verrucomicrobiota bacterium]
MLKILVTGCRGRMGQAVSTAVIEDPETHIGAGIDLGDSVEDGLAKSDIAIDFTLPSFTNELIDAVLEAGTPLVMGTTGHDEGQLTLIREASQRLPIVHAPNFSI